MAFWFLVAVNIGDWVEVQCDYSPGVCSEGGTGVVIAKLEGRINYDIEQDISMTLNLDALQAL